MKMAISEAVLHSETKCKSITGLRSQCLPFSEVIAQSIANIAPSASPALAIPLVFATAGNATWLCYLFATIAVLLVGYHINHFAKRSASSGALYNYITEGLGPTTGFVSGWALVLAYLLTGGAVLAGVTNYINAILGYAGIKAAPLILTVITGLSAWYIAYKDIKLSAKLMLMMEAVSLGLIIVLGGIVFFKSGYKVDMAQLTLKGVSFDSLRIGLVLAFFSFVGFESATVLGDEAKNPLKNIPKAVLISGAIVGTFFVIIGYVEIMGFIGSVQKLNEVAAPLTVLADNNSVGFMGFLISIGAVISFWSCAVACTIAGARLLMTMGRHRILPNVLSRVHDNNDTPYVAVSSLGLVAILIPGILEVFNCGALDIFGWLGTIATLGFLLNYGMIVLAAPTFLYKRKELKAGHVIVAAISIIIVLIPIVGSIYPLPAYPYSMFPFIFLGWVVMAMLLFAVAKMRNTNLIVEMHKDIRLSSETNTAA
jgi:amino acid transporter